MSGIKQYCMAKLKEFAQLESDEQIPYKEEINRFFNEFWSCNPTREEFNETMGGILITADILYTIAKYQPGDVIHDVKVKK